MLINIYGLAFVLCASAYGVFVESFSMLCISIETILFVFVLMLLEIFH